MIHLVRLRQNRNFLMWVLSQLQIQSNSWLIQNDLRFEKIYLNFVFVFHRASRFFLSEKSLIDIEIPNINGIFVHCYYVKTGNTLCQHYKTKQHGSAARIRKLNLINRRRLLIQFSYLSTYAPSRFMKNM